MSTAPDAIASRKAAVNTPTPISATGAAERSPEVEMMTSSAGCPSAIRASRMVPAWVVASRLPRVPIRIGVDRVNPADSLKSEMV